MVFSFVKWNEQGDPMSGYLFSLCEDSLFIQIRGDDNIEIIVTGNCKLKLTAYADDANILTLDVRSLQTIFQTCNVIQS